MNVVTFLLLFVTLSSSIHLEGNGYVNILVSLPLNTSAADGPIYIDKLKAIFKESSQLLYECTNGKAYFKNVQFLVPSSWKLAIPDMELIKGHQFRMPDIQLEDEDSDCLSSTQQSASCKSSGEFIRLNTKILDRNVTHAAQHLVSQWASFQYLTFPEPSLDTYSRPRFLNAAPEKPAFQAVEIASRARYSFVVQGQSSIKNFNELVYHTIKDAIKFLVKNVIPDDAVINIVVFTDKVHEKAFGDETSKLTTEKRKELLENLNEYGTQSPNPLALTGGLRKAEELLEPNGGTVILLGMLEELKLDTTTELKESRFSALTFKTGETHADIFSDLEKKTSETNGTILCLEIDRSSSGTFFWKIVDGLVSLYNSAEGRSVSLATIYQEVDDSTVRENNGTFWVPPSESEKFAFLARCKMEIIRATVNGEEMMKEDPKSYYFTGNANETEKYDFQVGRDVITHCIFLVVTQQKVARRFPVHWEIKEIEVDKKTVKALYTNLNGRNSLNVDAWVNVYHSRRTDSFKLLDSGGDPDAKAGDGTYSGYWLPILEEGIYSLSLNITRRKKDSERVFFHYSFLGSYRVTEAGKLNLVDFPPSPIRNLKLIGFTDEFINMNWTAPGGYLDKGIATSYQVRYSSDRDFLNGQELVQYNGTTVPQEAGSTENVACYVPSISVYKTLQPIYIATHSVNQEGKISDVSNIIEVNLESKGSTTGEVIEDDTTPADCLGIVSDNQEATKKELIIIYSISFAGFVLLVIIVNLSICWCWAANRRNENGKHHLRNALPVKTERTKHITIARVDEENDNLESRNSTEITRNNLEIRRPAFRHPSQDATESEQPYSVERRQTFPRNINDTAVHNDHQELIEAYSSTTPINLDHLKAKNLPRSSQNPNGYALDENQNTFRPVVHTEENPSAKSTFYTEHEAVPPQIAMSRPTIRHNAPISLNNRYPQDGDSYDSSDDERPYLSNPIGVSMYDLVGHNLDASTSGGNGAVPRYKVDDVYYALPENRENKREVPTTYV